MRRERESFSKEEILKNIVELLGGEARALQKSGAYISLRGLHAIMEESGEASALRTIIQSRYASLLQGQILVNDILHNAPIVPAKEQENVVSVELLYNEMRLTPFVKPSPIREVGKLTAYDSLSATAYPDLSLRLMHEIHRVRPDQTVWRQRLSTSILYEHEWRREGAVHEILSDMYKKHPTASTF